MAQYIDKSALVAEIEKLISNGQVKLQESQESNDYESYIAWSEHIATCIKVLSFIDTLEVKEVEETMSIAYVVTRSEEHSDYVEKVFFDEDKAQEYCDQFKGNENEYARHITKVEVTL